MDFETGLATLFRSDSGGHLLGHLALAECTGLSDRAREWLRRRLEGEPEGRLRLGWFGNQSLDQIGAIGDAVFAGSPREIFNVVRAAVADEDDVTLGLALSSIIVPLVLTGRGATLRALQGELPPLLAADFTNTAAFNLGSCGEWENAIAVLEHAHADGANPGIGMAIESLMWKHAYLQGGVDTVLPRLAAIPFHRELAHAEEARAWQLKYHQVRAGRGGAPVPALPGDQSPAYVEAAAIQIAALEGDATAADLVRGLRDALASKTISIEFADRGIGIAFEPVSDALFKARARVAARRKNYAELERLARSPAPALLIAPDVVIDALIEEGDWRAAADCAERHDPRNRAVIEGFDDTRQEEHRDLQLILAAAACRGGCDADAQRYLSRYVEASIAFREMPRPEDEGDDLEELGGAAVPSQGPPGLWPATLLAGAAAGVLPRRFLAVLLPVFRSAY
jgi:hypothetical protein